MLHQIQQPVSESIAPVSRGIQQNLRQRILRTVVCGFCNEYGHTHRYCRHPECEPTIRRCTEMAIQNIENQQLFYNSFELETIDVLKLFGSRRGIYGVNSKREIINILYRLYCDYQLTNGTFDYDIICTDFVTLPPATTIEKWNLLEENTNTPDVFEEECPICYIELTRTNCCKLNCKHKYCSTCIKTMKDNAAKCNELYIQCPMRCGNVSEIFYYTNINIPV